MSIEHFEVLSIELPYVNGTCTIPQGVNWSQGYHTPITCVESGNDTWTYYFGTAKVPISVNEFEARHPIYRQIKSISETTPTLKLDGMASRGSLSVTFNDWEGDPGPVNTTPNGTYMSKFNARNFLSGREVKLYRFTREGGVNTITSTSVYLSEALKVSASGDYTLTCKSYLERTYKDYNQYPPSTDTVLRLDIDETATEIPVNDSQYDWASLPKAIKIGDDLMTPVSYDSGTEILTVQGRSYGVKGVGGNSISRTVAEEHDAGDNIQICTVSDEQPMSDYLVELLLAAELPPSYLDATAWQSEFDDYWAGTTITNVWHEPIAVKDRINSLCMDYMLDIWESALEPAKIKVSAVSAWKEPSQDIVVGRGITELGFTYSTKPDERASRTFVKYDKPFKTENDDAGNYKKVAINSDTTYETDDFYGSTKSVELESSSLLNTNDATLRTQRNTSRFSVEPREYSWDCEEKYLNYLTGDIVSFTHQDLQNVEGDSEVVRAQIIQTKPQYSYKGVGRAYKIKALTYLQAISGGGGENITYRKDSVISEIDIHNDFAGRPSQSVDWTVVLDNCTVLSDDTANPSIRNGAFADGSTVTIICINGTDWQSHSGDGGNGAGWIYETEFNPPWIQTPFAGDGGDGGICFNADGVDTEIYLEGATGNPAYPTADGYIRAPGGGGGGSGGSSIGTPGNGGGSGAGNTPAVGGAGGSATDFFTTVYGEPGQDGDTNGNGGTGAGGINGGNWGQNGVGAGGIGPGQGGLAGSGLIKSGATVTIQYTDTARFINGSGDTPD